MRRRRLAVAAALVALVVGVVATRAVWQGSAALERGDAALVAGDRAEAIRWWRRAARWYLPLAPHVERAYDRLAELAAQAEEHGDRPTALAAYQAIRSSILSTRSTYVPFEERLDPANRRIAALMAAAEPANVAAGADAAAREAWHLRALDRDEMPTVGWTLVALLGFATWIAGAALFAWRGLDADDRLVRRTAGRAGALVAVGLVVWLLGLHLA